MKLQGKFGNEIIAAIYIRVSSTEQAEEGYSVGSQTDKLTSYCNAMGYKIFGTYIDPGVSGASINRPAMQRLIQDVQKDKLDVVIVMKLDRLSRSQKDTLYLIEDVFEAHSTSFVSVTESFDTGSPMGKAFVGILAVFAQFERERIKERVEDGKMERAKSGKMMNWYKVPIGYEYDQQGKTLLVNEYEASIVQKTFSMYAAGYSASAISDALLEEYPAGTKYNQDNKRIPVATIRRMLQNETYLGRVKYKKKIFEGVHPPIVTEELFNKVQQSMASRIGTASQTRKHPFRSTHLLTGFVCCGKCGNRMHAQTRRHINNNKWYYICYARSRSGKYYTENMDICDAKVIDGESLDNMLIEQVRKLKYDDAYYGQVCSKEPEDVDTTSYVVAQIEAIDKKLNKLVDLYLSDSFSKEELDTRRKKLMAEKDTLSNSLSKKSKTKKITKKEVADALKDFETVFAGDDLAMKKNMLSMVVDSIAVYESYIDIKWSF